MNRLLNLVYMAVEERIPWQVTVMLTDDTRRQDTGTAITRRLWDVVVYFAQLQPSGSQRHVCSTDCVYGDKLEKPWCLPR